MSLYFQLLVSSFTNASPTRHGITPNCTNQARSQLKIWGVVHSSPSLSPLPSLPFLSLPSPFPLPLALEVGPLNPARGSGGTL